MNFAHVHLMLNHAPILGSAAGVLLLLYARLRGLDEVRRVGLAFLVISALVAWPVFLSGERAEDRVEHLPGVSERVIDPHEDSAKISLALVCLAGLAAAGGLIAFRGRREPGLYASVTLALALAAAAHLAWTANLGGMIRHSEIRGGAAGAASGAPADSGESHEAGETHER